MSKIITLHPNGTIANSGFVVTGASAHAALADPSAANYVTGEEAAADSLEFNWETYVIPANERVKRLRGILNIARYPGNTQMSIDYGPGSFRTINSNTTGVVQLNGSWQSLIGLSSPCTGMSQAEVDGITSDIDSTYVGDSFLVIYEARIELEVILRPEVTLPADAYVYHRDPNATILPWDYIGNGEVQKKYHAKIFTQAQVIGGGFDPDVTVPIWDSGIVTSSNDFVTASGLAYDTEYVFFVKVAKDWTMSGCLTTDWWSDWEQTAPWFTLSQPVATSILPTSMALTTNKPLVSWVMDPTAADENPDPVQKAFRVKIFKIPGGGWGGFNPDTNVADLVEDSGWVTSTATSYQGTVALANLTEHRAYIMLRRTSGSLSPDIDGPWAFSTFATDFIAPATPVISTAIAANGVDVQVTVTPGLKNLLNYNQSSVESNVFGYATVVTAGPGTAAPFQEAVIASHGTKSLGVDATGAAGARTIDIEATAEVACTAGLTYTAQCEVRKVVGQPARQVRVGLRWFAAGDVLISTSWGAASAAGDAFGQRTVTAVAPPTAVEVTIVMEIANVDLAPEHHYFDKMMIEQTNAVNAWHVGGTPDEQFYIIQHRIAGGEWEYFDIGGDLTTEQFFHTVEPFVITDYEGCINKNHEYRVAAVGTALGVQTQSPWSNVDNETITKQEVWIKDLFDPTYNRHYYVGEKWLNRTKRKARMIQRPLGRNNPVVIRGIASDTAFAITFIVFGEAEMDNLMEMVDNDRPLFLQTPKGNWYVEVAGDLSIREHLWDKKKTLPSGATEEDVYQVVLTVQEVDP